MLFENVNQIRKSIALMPLQEPCIKTLQKFFFWHSLPKNKRQNCTSCSVGGFSRLQVISDMWKQHYSGLINCIPETSQTEKDFVNSSIDSTMQVVMLRTSNVQYLF